MKTEELINHFKNRRPVLLIVLDGWGLGRGDQGDAIFHASTPVMDRLAASS
ncbi:MAG: hypothetical protein OEZ59_13270, partial [Deltaproteobacteria bacterium]|nr:hypothetical protein [Deltaproteobacteria bacterium]